MSLLTGLLVLLGVQPHHAQNQQTTELQKHYSKGLELFQTGNPEAAESEFRTIIQMAPRMPEPYYFLAKIALHRNSLEQAESVLGRALELKPDFVEARHTLGVVLFQRKRYEQARDTFQRVIQQKPDYGLAYVNLGSVYLRLQQVDEALKQFHKALEIKPAKADVSFRANLQLGLIYLGREENMTALKHFEKAQSVDPHDLELLFSLAETYLKLQRRAEALEITHQIANLADSDSDKHLRLGLLLVENQLYREAINELQEARKHLAPSFEMLYALATVYYHSDRNSDAIDVLREALRLRPNDANSYYLMARVYGALKDSRVIEALR